MDLREGKGGRVCEKGVNGGEGEGVCVPVCGGEGHVGVTWQQCSTEVTAPHLVQHGSTAGSAGGKGDCTWRCMAVHGGTWRYMAVHGDTTGSYLVQQRLDGRQRSSEAREQWQYDDVEELWRDTCVVVHSKEAGGH